LSETKTLSSLSLSLSQEDLDLLALLLEGLEKEKRPRSKKWLLAFLAGPSPEETGNQIFSEAPEKVSSMARAIIQMNLRINYNRGKRIFQRKLNVLLSFALATGLIEPTRRFLRKLYRSTPLASTWLEEEYGKQRSVIKITDQQAWYNAQKLCRTLSNVAGGLSTDELRDKAFPMQEVPADATPRLRAILESYVASVPEAFQTALQLAEENQWLTQEGKKWKVTLAGVEEFKLNDS
jgi:hypothetical protein